MSGTGRALRNFFKQIDIKLLIIALVASTFGLILITSATRSMGSGSFIKVQLVATVVGIFLYLILSWLDLESVSSWWKYVYIINLLLHIEFIKLCLELCIGFTYISCFAEGFILLTFSKFFAKCSGECHHFIHGYIPFVTVLCHAGGILRRHLSLHQQIFRVYPRFRFQI